MSAAQPIRISVVGAGHVGTTFAYAALLSGLAAEIVLVDANQARAEGEAMDLGHAIPFTHPTNIRAGTLEDCAGSAIVVFTAGAAQNPGETRLDLMRRNAALVRDIVPQIARAAPECVLLMATNPVDLLTREACRVSGLPHARVIGSGTVLDTARFRYLLGRHYGIDPHNVHAYIIGEHGDSEVPVWSLANVAGMPLREYALAQGKPFREEELEAIFRATRDAAYRIIERKGATYYAIAAGLLRIVESILRDEHSVLTVSMPLDGPYGLHDVCLSVPAVLGRGGVERILHLALDESELRALRRSAELLQAAAAAAQRQRSASSSVG
jgi:L-lactate dehydrogenase